MFKKWLSIALIIFLQYEVIYASNIKGRIKVDPMWDNFIYLSAINSFDDLNTASYDFLIARTGIDSTGFFEFNGLELPTEDRIYRLHICKKGDPVSTIIIGGQEENFIHFIMKNGDSIQLLPSTEIQGIQHSQVKGNRANANLKKLFKWQKNLNSPPAMPSEQGRKLLREKTLSDYAKIADTSSNIVIQMLSMYLMYETSPHISQIELMEKIKNNTQASDTSSPYFKSFIDELSYLKYQSKLQSRGKMIWATVIAIAMLILSIIINKIFFGKNSITDSIIDYPGLIKQLSFQEKRVLDLLKEGKTNKEISQELHIEVSTVKSHLNKIYSRLGVEGRKDIINANW